MERTKIDKENPVKAIEHVFANAMGNPVILKDTPASDDLKANTMAIYGNYLYVKFANGTVLRFSGTAI